MTLTLSRQSAPLDFLIGRIGPFEIAHCRSCAVPGYLIVSAGEGVHSFGDFSADALRQIGPVLAAAEESVRVIINPLRVYCALFGETEGAMHFHLFPRTHENTAGYLEAYPDHAGQIHGPVLFDWARDHYRRGEEEVFHGVLPVMERLKDYLSRKTGSLLLEGIVRADGCPDPG